MENPNAKRCQTFLTFLLSLFISITFVLPSIGFAETSYTTFEARYLNAEAVLFLEDGRIIYALGNSDGILPRTVSTILCTNMNGTTLWSCDIPMVLHSPRSALKQMADGAFAFLGYLKESDIFSVAVIDSWGNLQDTINLPKEASGPILASDGVFYALPTQDINHYDLLKVCLDEKKQPTSLLGIEKLTLYQVEESASGVYVHFTHRNQEGVQMRSIASLNDAYDVIWQYALGEMRESYCDGWVDNDYNGITLTLNIQQEDMPAKYYLICLDGEGKLVWESEISSGLALAFDVIHQDKRGHYEIWGRASFEGRPIATFKLLLDQNGKEVSINSKMKYGICFPYIDSLIYTVVNLYDAPSLLSFSALETLTELELDLSLK